MGFTLGVVIRKEAKWYVGSWLGGFEWPIFVGADAFAYGKTGSECGRDVRTFRGGALCHCVVEQVISGAFEEAMRWCACAVMGAGYCVLVHGRLCSVQRILPRRECG